MTDFWLSNTVESGLSVGSYAEKQLALSEQAGGAVNAGATLTAGGNHIELDVSASVQIWLYRVNAVTISGSVSFRIWGLENAMTDNTQPGVRVVRINNSGSILSDVVADANAGHVPASEWGTTLAVKTWSATPTSTSFSDGDWIGVITHVDAIGTMAAGANATRCRFNDSAANSADGKVIFTETIPPYAPAGAPLGNRQYPQLLAQ